MVLKSIGDSKNIIMIIHILDCVSKNIKIYLYSHKTFKCVAPVAVPCLFVASQTYSPSPPRFTGLFRIKLFPLATISSFLFHTYDASVRIFLVK